MRSASRRSASGAVAARRPSRVERGEVVLPREGPGRRSACSGGLWRVSHGKDHGSSGEPAIQHRPLATMLKFTVHVPPAPDWVLDAFWRHLSRRFGLLQDGTRMCVGKNKACNLAFISLVRIQISSRLLRVPTASLHSRCASHDHNRARGEKLEAKDQAQLEKIGCAAREGCKTKTLPAAR